MTPQLCAHKPWVAATRAFPGFLAPPWGSGSCGAGFQVASLRGLEIHTCCPLEHGPWPPSACGACGKAGRLCSLGEAEVGGQWLAYRGQGCIPTGQPRHGPSTHKPSASVPVSSPAVPGSAQAAQPMHSPGEQAPHRKQRGQVGHTLGLWVGHLCPHPGSPGAGR